MFCTELFPRRVPTFHNMKRAVSGMWQQVDMLTMFQRKVPPFWRRWKFIPLKPSWTCARLYGIIFRKTVIFIVTALRSQDLTLHDVGITADMVGNTAQRKPLFSSSEYNSAEHYLMDQWMPKSQVNICINFLVLWRVLHSDKTFVRNTFTDYTSELLLPKTYSNNRIEIREVTANTSAFCVTFHSQCLLQSWFLCTDIVSCLKKINSNI